ncbi:hypothetical protein TD95_001034 [Thielaviopsis punctulata]|uniref:Indoleamine 2,3-dioxygenase n=1 Tax=Thielaviopsis punctulata TaxID=72032 RepID=A0A0F4ZKI0_9PEZI|nr:hypothetical protein TD95_001034 [Thielaviopsis punctulata]
MPALITDPPYAQLLANHAITANGFLPLASPLARLPPTYDAWEDIAHHLPKLLAAGDLRAAVDRLPVLPADGIQTEQEWRRAYVVLAFLTHAYIWCGAEPAATIPPAITVPFLAVCATLDLPPVLTYAASNLWNFCSSSPTLDFTDVSTLTVPMTFTGTRSEEWFFKISVAMEAQGAATIPRMLGALDAVARGDFSAVADALEHLAEAIHKTTQLLNRMHEGCDPATFYHAIRPFLAGTKNMASVGLPNGVFFDEGSGRGTFRALRGGSNGQSSLIQFWDLVLGVNHRGEADGDETFHEQVRGYMPGGHRRFLANVRETGGLRKAVLHCRDERVREMYGRAVGALTEFRNAHIGIVTRYIVTPSRRAAGRNVGGGGIKRVKTNLATVSAGKDELTGTGGTALIPFLKQSRDETREAGLVD